MPPIERISVWYMHWQGRELNDTIAFIEGHDEAAEKPIQRYEIEVRYNDGNVVRGEFKEKEAAIDFLRIHQTVLP